jgi:hypothetical protein
VRVRVVTAATGAVLAVGLSGCVGPALSTGGYEAKAARTANDAASHVETALLAVSAAATGRLTAAYLRTVLSDAETGFSSVQNTFASIQPPDSRTADQWRQTLGDLLSTGSDALSQLRIESRRGAWSELATTARSLRPVADQLERFSEEHSR